MLPDQAFLEISAKMLVLEHRWNKIKLPKKNKKVKVLTSFPPPPKFCYPENAGCY